MLLFGSAVLAYLADPPISQFVIQILFNFVFVFAICFIISLFNKEIKSKQRVFRVASQGLFWIGVIGIITSNLDKL